MLYQRHSIEIFSDYSLSPDVAVILCEFKKQKYNTTKLIFRLTLKPEVYSSRETLFAKNGQIKFYCVWPTVFK